MKKKFRSENLILDQLQTLNQQEAKLLKPPSKNAINEKLSPMIDKIEEKIPDKLQSTLELTFEKAFRVVFQNGLHVIEKSYNKNDIAMENDINTYALNKYPTKKNMNKIDFAVAKKNTINQSISLIEGTALGILGIGIADIPIFIGVILKSVYEICLSYGFDYDSSIEKVYILNIISAATTTGTARGDYFNKLDKISHSIDYRGQNNSFLESTLKETSNNLSIYMLTSKFIQGLPIVGVVGGVANLKILHDITTIAKIKYKKRYLTKISSL